VKPEQKKPLIGIVVGAVLTAIGPLLGLIITVVGLQRSFDQVSGGSIDPSQKATHLASGISSSMTATAVGVGVGSFGMVVVMVSLAMFLSAKPHRDRAP